MAKSNTIQVKMVSTADTGYFYVKFRNPKTKTEIVFNADGDVSRFALVIRVLRGAIISRLHRSSLPISL